MRVALLALALLPSAAFAAITINGPSASSYWVQNTSNLISWSFTQGDAATVDIVVSNSNNQTLNGNFSIARSVPVSQESFTVTDVTLRVGTGYQVSFFDTTETQVLAQSSAFEVKAPGTSPAPTANPSSTTPQGTGSGSGSGTSGNGTGSGSAASSTSTSSKKSNAALGLAFDARGLFSVCGIIAFGALFL
ncbi:hypothetical protein V8E52_011783 [Russula decolorans]|jgi:hypothetical protein